MRTKSQKPKSVAAVSKILLLIGFAFFINPVPFGLDILPDVIGCALIYFGLTQLAYFDGSVDEARKCFSYLLIVEAVHLIMMRSVFLTNISSNRMLAVTALAIVEGILYILIFKRLFDGISYLAMRNNFNETLSCCDGIAFMTYLAFFVRLAAMLIPELVAIFEMQLYLELDYDRQDALLSLVNAKPLLVVMLTCISLGISIAWFVSLSKLIRTLHKESATELDNRYSVEFTQKPEKVRIKKLRHGIFALNLSLFFIIDLAIDGKRIIPASLMFLCLFISAFLLKDVSDFKQTKRLAIPAFLLLLSTKIFKKLLVPNGAIIIYETDIKIVLFALLLAILTFTCTLLCIRGFLQDIRKLSYNLSGKEIGTSLCYLFYSATTVFWAVGFVIPYLYSFIAAPRLICAGLFVWSVIKTLGIIYENELEHISLYN